MSHSRILKLTLLVGAALMIAVAAGAAPVTYLYSSLTYQSAGMHAYGKAALEGYVEVENIAYEKRVTLFYQFKNHGWEEVEASYVKSLGGNKELWRFKTSYYMYHASSPPCFKLAVRYRVDNKEYWDNNNGRDYSASWVRNLGQSRLVLNRANATVPYYTGAESAYLNGEIVVKNVAYHKQVKIVYTLDNWTTVKEATAVYDRTVSTWLGITEMEVWKFEIEFCAVHKQVKFAVAMTANGTTAWDNNFGEDYTIAVPGSLE